MWVFDNLDYCNLDYFFLDIQRQQSHLNKGGRLNGLVDNFM
jgi:hypothetical protein